MEALNKTSDPQTCVPYKPLAYEARENYERFITDVNGTLYEQLVEIIRIVWHTNSSDEPLSLVSVDADYATLIIYKTWQYDTELFTRLVADAGFPHLCKDITALQNAVVFISWNASKEKSKP